MSLVSDAVAALFGGVSQQAPVARDPSFVESGDNCYPHITLGLAKRQPEEHIAQLTNALTATTYKIAWIIRGTSAALQYVAVFTGSTVRVFRLSDGFECTVSTPNGTTYITTAAPRTDLRVVSVMDTTFIVNTTKTPAMKADRSGQPVTPVAVSSITRASQTATVNTAAPHLLATGDWILMAGATQPEYNGWFQITVTGGSAFTYTVTGSPATPATGSPAYTAVKGTPKGKKQTFSALPTTSLTSGEVWEIEGDDTNPYDGYFVKWNSTDSVWEECPEPGSQYIIDPDNMPWTLANTGATTFTFDRVTWNNRVCGNSTSSPTPSFIGAQINEVFYANSRLGFLSGANFIMTRAGQPFHFFRRTVTAIIDDDPIDRTVTHSQRITLRWAVPFTKKVLLFHDAGQLELVGGEVFTNATARADPATAIITSTTMRPAAIGSDVVFAAQRETFATMHEYYVQENSTTNVATDVTVAVPRFVPADLIESATSSVEDLAVFLADSQKSNLYLYKRHWVDAKRVQMAWARMVFDSGDSNLGIQFVGSTLYRTYVRSDGLYLGRIRFEPGLIDVVTNYPATGDGFRVHLDRRVSLTGVYDAGNNWTTWTLPYADSASFETILGTPWTGRVGEKITTTRPTSSTVRAVGDYSANVVWIGRSYTKTARLTECFKRDRNGIPIVSGKLMLRFLRAVLGRTGYLRAEVTPDRRGTRTYKYTGKLLGTSSATLGRAPVGDAVFMFTVLSDSRRVTIDLINDSYLPSSILGYEWEGTFDARSSR